MALMPENCWNRKSATPVRAARLRSTSPHDGSAPPSSSLPACHAGRLRSGCRLRRLASCLAAQACQWAAGAAAGAAAAGHSRRQATEAISPRQASAPAPSCVAAASSPHSFWATSVASRRRPLSTSQVGDSGQISMPGGDPRWKTEACREAGHACTPARWAYGRAWCMQRRPTQRQQSDDRRRQQAAPHRSPAARRARRPPQTWRARRCRAAPR